MISDFALYAVRGIPIGCVFGLLAVGLVLTYKTSGVFNLAFAAQAYVSAAVFYETRKEHEWPLVPAALLAVVVVGPLVGIILDRFLYRHQRTAGSLPKLITALGLLVAIPEIVKIVLGSESRKNPPPLWWVRRSDDFLWPQDSRFVLDASQIATLSLTAIAVVGLAVVFRRSAIGLRMRAVVESPRLVQLQGIDADRVSMVSWILSSLMAGLAGLLIAPLFAQLSSLDFFSLLVAAIAACVFAGLTNIVAAFVGGLLLGVLQAELAGFLPTDSILATGLRPALPFVVLFALVLVRRSARTSHEITDPLAGVDPPPPPPAMTLRPRWLTFGTRGFGVGVAVIGLAVSLFVLDDFWLSLVTGGVALAVILLSVVVTTGIGGTVSLCQATLAAIGAFTTAQLVDTFGTSVLLAMLAGAAVAAAVGALLSLPVIRLAGIYPALATLAFALMFQGVLVPQEWVSGGLTPLSVPRPLIGPIDFADDGPFLLLCVFFLAVLSLGVIALRQGTTGRFLDAIRESEPAASAVGINPVRPRVVAFVVGSAIAGFGGGLLASFNGLASYDQSFNFQFGLVWLVLVITAGSRSVQSAIISGVAFFVLPQLLVDLFTFPGNYLESNPETSGLLKTVFEAVEPRWAQQVAFVLFGFGALTYAKHPEGIIEAQTSKSIRKVLGIIERAKGRKGSPPAEGLATPVSAGR